MTTYDQRPECPEGDGITSDEVTRMKKLRELADDENAKALTPTEVDDLHELEARWARYLVYRGKVDRYFADQKKERETPPNPADPKNLVGMALRAYHEGKGKSLKAIKSKPRTGLANAEPHSTAGRGHGRGIERMAGALRRGEGLTR